ncbi:MAG: hypothetical protein QF619_09285, partial [Candidatus Binatia bacterium]|nr:hypothetical protein [Candidatus Binatia bacterium]
YFFERRLFPLAFCEFTLNDNRRLCKIRTLSSPREIDYTLPDLRILALRTEGLSINPKHHRGKGQLEVIIEGETQVLEPQNHEELVVR